MVDKRTHRGKHPQDERLFAPGMQDTLRQAVSHLAWLLTRGYALESALKLVGDRFALIARQRTAIMRSTCSDLALEHRRQHQRALAELQGGTLNVDGYNLLITIESALSGGLIMVGRDGCCRDLASIHGTYRKVEETLPALHLIIDHLEQAGPRHVNWLLDRPVGNSGRLKTLMAETLEDRQSSVTWNIELVPDPDAVLSTLPGALASSDSVVLDRCTQWVNLAAEIISERIAHAWIVDLRSCAD